MCESQNRLQATQEPACESGEVLARMVASSPKFKVIYCLTGRLGALASVDLISRGAE